MSLDENIYSCVLFCFWILFVCLIFGGAGGHMFVFLLLFFKQEVIFKIPTCGRLYAIETEIVTILSG